METHSEVMGLHIEFTEEIVAEVTSLPQSGRAWFGRRTCNVTTMREFLLAGEQVCQAKRGITLQPLPHSWNEVEVFLKNYITCEGRYQTVYFSEFPLLSHLCHRALLNIPFYLFKDLHHMAGFVRSTQHPYYSLTHQFLIKLFILRALAQRNQTWEQFTSQPQINQGPVLLHGVPIEEEVEAPALLWGVQI